MAKPDGPAKRGAAPKKIAMPTLVVPSAAKDQQCVAGAGTTPPDRKTPM